MTRVEKPAAIAIVVTGLVCAWLQAARLATDQALEEVRGEVAALRLRADETQAQRRACEDEVLSIARRLIASRAEAATNQEAASRESAQWEERVRQRSRDAERAREEAGLREVTLDEARRVSRDAADHERALHRAINYVTTHGDCENFDERDEDEMRQRTRAADAKIRAARVQRATAEASEPSGGGGAP